MNGWKVIPGIALTAVLLWFVYPSHTLRESDSHDNVVEIAFMRPGGALSGAIEDVVQQFERLSEQAHARDPRHPIYRVISGQHAARDQVADPTRFLISVAGGVPPDVIWFDRYAIAEWAARGAFVPLDPYIERDLAAANPDAIHPERFYKPCWDEACYNDKVYGIPNNADDRALIYNKDLLKRAGLVDKTGQAKPPRTWDELEGYAVKLTEYDERGKIKVVGFAPRYCQGWLYSYGWMAGGEFMSADGTQCTLNHPRIVEALTYMSHIYDELGGYAKVNAFQAGFQTGYLDPFMQGKIAMKIDGSGQMMNFARYGQDIDFGIAPFPLPKRELDKGRQVTWTGGWAYAIPITARKKDAAWEFIRFMSSDQAWTTWMESARELAQAQGQMFIPQQISIRHLNERFFQQYVFDNPLIPQRFKDGCKVYNDLLPHSYYRPVTPVGQLLWNEHINAMEQALYNRATPQQALDRSTAVVQKDLDRILNPVAGSTINWTGFFVGYGLLLIALAVVVYLWDTGLGFRHTMGRLLLLKHKSAHGIIEGSRGGYFRRQWRGGLICAAPWIIGFIVFGGGPMLFSILISFCDYDILNPPKFIGLHNYKWMLTEDPLFATSLFNTVFMVVGIPLGMAVGLGIALLLNLKVRGVALWRTLFYLPAIVPMVASSILWIWILNPEGGIINLALAKVGVSGPLWLQDAHWSKPALILMGLWAAGGGMIIWLAGLNSISEQLYEAASIDGATAWQRFRHITIPQLSPYIFFNLVMGVIHTFQIFGQAFIMTQGGPVNSTLFYVYHLFNNAFRYGHMGYASAMAWVLFVIILALTIVQLKLSRRWVHYEGD